MQAWRMEETFMERRTLLRGAALAPLALATPGLAVAQSFPARPIRLIIPWPAGQATDIIGRLIAEGLTPLLGQPVVPDNRAGAGGTIGTDNVAKAAPDGHTLLAASSGPVSVAPLLRRLPFDVERDLAPVAMAGNSPYLLVTRPGFPATNMQEFIAAVRAAPGRYTFASSGAGATAHLVSEAINRRLGFEVTHVPFTGSAAGVAAVAGGHVDYVVETLAATQPVIRSANLRALGISLLNGSTLAPDVPPLSRVAGLEGFDLGAWLGLMVPARTPAPIVTRLADAMREVMRNETLLQRMAAAGVEPTYRDTEAFADNLRAQREVFSDVIRQANIRIE